MRGRALSRPISRSLAVPSGLISRGAGDPLGWVPRFDGQLPAVHLDFKARRYFWDGAERAEGDLLLQGTAAIGAEGLDTGAAGWAEIPWDGWHNTEEMTVFADLLRDWPNSDVGTGTIFSFGQYQAPTRAEFDLTDRSQGRALLFDAGNFDQISFGNGGRLSRYGFSYKAAGAGVGAVSEAPGNLLMSSAPGVTLGSGAEIGRRRFDRDACFGASYGGRILSLTLCPRQITTEAFDARMLHTTARNWYVLGDSFVPAYSDDGAGLSFAFRQLLTDAYRVFSMDGVGGSTLTEQAARYAAASAEERSRVLIVMDGGFDSTVAEAIAALQAMHAASISKEWLYVQPSPENKVLGSPERAQWDADQAAVRAWIEANAGPARYVECLPALIAGSDGNPGDEADAAAGIVPRSLRLPGDVLHENPQGGLIRGGEILAAAAALGW